MEAVTTYWREWRWAAMAPARSIQCMRRPPRSALSGLASLGSTISVISEIDSRTGRGVNFALSPSFINRLQEHLRLAESQSFLKGRGFSRAVKPFFLVIGRGSCRYSRLPACGLVHPHADSTKLGYPGQRSIFHARPVRARSRKRTTA